MVMFTDRPAMTILLLTWDVKQQNKQKKLFLVVLFAVDSCKQFETRPVKMSGLIWIKTVCHSKEFFEKVSRRQKSSKVKDKNA